MKTKGIILAGGLGARLWPVTKATSKPLVPVYDKPMIYYPLSVLMMAGIKDILLISSAQNLLKFKELFGNGENLGISLSYEEEKTPKGTAEAFIIGENFVGKDNVSLIFCDNIFHGANFDDLLNKSRVDVEKNKGGVVFGYYVNDPEKFGVVNFDDRGNIISIEEKPRNPKSNYALIGLYFYDNDVLEIARNLKPSQRGELEITDVNKEYLKRGKLKVEFLNKEFKWFDAGNCDSLLEASNFIAELERRQNIKLGCIEEIAYQLGYMDKNKVIEIANSLGKTNYAQYLLKKLN